MSSEITLSFLFIWYFAFQNIKWIKYSNKLKQINKWTVHGEPRLNAVPVIFPYKQCR